MKTPVRQVLASNLSRLMSAHKDRLGTGKKIEAACGVSQRTVSNLLNPERGEVKHSPRLDQVEKLAKAFGLAPWQLLLDPSMVGAEMADLLMRPSVQDGDPRLTDWNAGKKHKAKA